MIAIQVHENKEELKTKLKNSLREKSDVFNMDIVEEDKVLTSIYLFLTSYEFRLHCCSYVNEINLSIYTPRGNKAFVCGCMCYLIVFFLFDFALI